MIPAERIPAASAVSEIPPAVPVRTGAVEGADTGTGDAGVATGSGVEIPGGDGGGLDAGVEPPSVGDGTTVTSSSGAERFSLDPFPYGEKTTPLRSPCTIPEPARPQASVVHASTGTRPYGGPIASTLNEIVHASPTPNDVYLASPFHDHETSSCPGIPLSDTTLGLGRHDPSVVSASRHVAVGARFGAGTSSCQPKKFTVGCGTQ